MTQPPTALRAQGQIDPLGLDTAPELSWAPQDSQRFLQVRIFDANGTTVWESGTVDSALPYVQSPVEPRARAAYAWQVRVSADAQAWTRWSDTATFEFSLLEATDWVAEWIARPVPAHARIVRSMVRERIEWADPGTVLTQSFSAPGAITAVQVDFTGELNTHVDALVEVVAAGGGVVGVRHIHGPQHIWERFMHFVELDPPAAPGDYSVRVTVAAGRVGWYAGDAPGDQIDDGVRPLPLRGVAATNGQSVAGVRAVGVETAPSPNPTFRYEFNVPEPVEHARLYAVALGNGEFRINGIPIDDAVLDPAPTDFDVRVLYRATDVATLLKPGANVIEVEAGRGTFAARGANTWGWNLAPWHAEPMLLAQLEWATAAGTRGRIATGAGWDTAAGTTVEDLLYCGEVSVSTSTEPVRKPASVVVGPSGTLAPAQLPPIRRIGTIRPVRVQPTAETRKLYDFGTMITGRVRCTIQGKPESRVCVRYGEALDDDQRVISMNDLAAGLMQIDEHRFDSEGELVGWEPKFGYRGFRWVEIETYGDAIASEPEAFLLHNDVESAGEFDTDCALLAWADGALRRTFLNNLQGIPTDTPIFEKNGWTADAMLATEALVQQIDLRSTFGKWIQDHADAQDAMGVVPQIVPSPGWARPADPAWSGSCVVIPWQMYWEYGDQRILQRADDMIRRYSEALITLADGRIWPIRSWGDWLPPGYMLPPEGTAAAATMMMVSVLKHSSRAMTVLGRDELALDYEAAAARTADAYHLEFFDPASCTYRVDGLGYRQSLNVLPLAFNAVPPELRAGVAESLAVDVDTRADGHLDTGAIGSRFLLAVLSSIGRDDLAVTIATQRTRPGWGPWFESGETTLMESWDVDARSRNHYFLGSALSWVHQRVGGIRPSAPGWASLEVAPVDDPRIRRGSIRHRTPRGEASIRWWRERDERHVELLVPPGSTASVRGAPHLETIGTGRHSLVLPPQ